MEEKRRELGQWIGHASVLFRRRLDRVVAAESEGYDDTVSGRNIWILRYIQEHGDEDVFQKDLENVFKIRRSTVSGTVELMEQKQLLVRESVDGDARLKRLRLTPKAEQLLQAVSLGIKRLEDAVRSAFDPSDYDRLMQLLEQFCSILEMTSSEFDRQNRKERNDETQ